MATAAFNEKKLRGIVKSALADAFKENRELMQDIVQEALEDIAMGRAIEQGKSTFHHPQNPLQREFTSCQ